MVQYLMNYPVSPLTPLLPALPAKRLLLPAIGR
jgi:hypothetical protein